jgi:hypothetical protein
MSGTHDQRVDAALLVGAAVTVALIAALAAWATQLGGGAWPPVLVPFAVALLVPVALWPHWRGCTPPRTPRAVPDAQQPRPRPGLAVGP